MNDKFDEDKLKQQFEKMKHKAEEVMDDPDQVKKVAESAWDKAKELKKPLAQVWQQLKSMIRLIRAWISGEYKDVPTTSVIAIIAGLMYLLSPVDLIPDFIPVLGYLDDIFVLGVVFTQVAKDIHNFEAWEADGGASTATESEKQVSPENEPETEAEIIIASEAKTEEAEKPETQV